MLIYRIWPDTPEKNAISLLHTSLYSIRRFLSAFGITGVIEYTEKKYAINMRKIESQLSGLLAARKDMENGQWQALPENNDILLKCVGDYLDGIDGEWVIEPREHIETIWLKCCRMAAERAMMEDKHSEAEALLKRYIGVDPYSEDIYEMLMQCSASRRDLKGIKFYYKKLKYMLMDELGVQPGKHAKQVYYQCLYSMGNPEARI